MQRTFIFAIVLLGLTSAHAQTGPQVGNQNSASGTGFPSDPLSVPTSSLSAPQGSAIGAGGSMTGSPTGTTGTVSSSGASGAISAPTSISPQSSLQLPGEAPGTSTQGASATATAPSAPSPICGPAVPSMDGGSANVTEIFGSGSLGGC